MGASRSTLFGTVAARDYLQFWQAGRFQPQRVARFLGLNRMEVAALAAVSPSSVRFDRKAPRDMQDRLIEIAATCELVAQFFGGDAAKTSVWFRSANPMLGDVSPCALIRAGRHEALRRFVMEALAEGAPTTSSPQPSSIATSGNAVSLTSSAADQLLAPHRQAIAGLCRRYDVRRLAVFGSLARSDFNAASSDVDLTVQFAPSSQHSPAHQYFGLKGELETLLGRPVDLVELNAMPDTRLKRLIERTQVPVYEQAA